MFGLSVIGVPSNSSGSTSGVARAPQALRAAGLLETLSRSCDVRDEGDVSLPTPSSARDEVSAVIDPSGLAAVIDGTSAMVAAALADGRFPLVIGGDCPLLLGCLAAARDLEPRAGLLFVDGHEDAYPPHRSTSGEAADMELAFALGLAPAPPGTRHPILSPSDVVVMGARDGPLLREEGVASLRGKVPLLDDAELATDPELMTRRALAAIPHPWWLHLDLDVLSSEALPSVDYRQEGGIGWLDLTSLTRTALAGAPMGWDVTIYNPDLDQDGNDAKQIVRFLGESLRMLAEA